MRPTPPACAHLDGDPRCRARGLRPTGADIGPETRRRPLHSSCTRARASRRHHRHRACRRDRRSSRSWCRRSAAEKTFRSGARDKLRIHWPPVCPCKTAGAKSASSSPKRSAMPGARYQNRGRSAGLHHAATPAVGRRRCRPSARNAARPRWAGADFRPCRYAHGRRRWSARTS